MIKNNFNVNMMKLVLVTLFNMLFLNYREDFPVADPVLNSIINIVLTLL